MCDIITKIFEAGFGTFFKFTAMVLLLHGLPPYFQKQKISFGVSLKVLELLFFYQPLFHFNARLVMIMMIITTSRPHP